MQNAHSEPPASRRHHRTVSVCYNVLCATPIHLNNGQWETSPARLTSVCDLKLSVYIFHDLVPLGSSRHTSATCISIAMHDTVSIVSSQMKNIRTEFHKCIVGTIYVHSDIFRFCSAWISCSRSQDERQYTGHIWQNRNHSYLIRALQHFNGCQYEFHWRNCHSTVKNVTRGPKQNRHWITFHVWDFDNVPAEPWGCWQRALCRGKKSN